MLMSIRSRSKINGGRWTAPSCPCCDSMQAPGAAVKGRRRIKRRERQAWKKLTDS